MSKSIHTFVVLAYKESRYLEQCICSVLHQSYKSDVVVATSTPNEYIERLCQKYQLEMIVNPYSGQGIGYDFDFARTCVNNTLVTIAHQDDVYDEHYSEKMVRYYLKYRESLILFPKYYEIRGNKKVYSNLNLKIKNILLTPLKMRNGTNRVWIKRRVLSLGDPICCPSVTFVNQNIQQDRLFSCDLLCDIDWKAWEILSRKHGRFTYINEPLMGHRVHEESTTTAIINDNVRTKEDLIILSCFWPRPIAKLIAKVYSLSEKSNSN